MVKLLGAGCDNEVVSELAAFCVHPDYRGSGRGDSLLAYLGQFSSLLSSCFEEEPLYSCFVQEILLILQKSLAREKC